MGQLTDTLRATLRDLAQSDARLYRGLQEELADTSQPRGAGKFVGGCALEPLQNSRHQGPQ
jgi:hypothetical protein